MIGNKLGRRSQQKEQAGGVSIFGKRSDLYMNAKCSLKDCFELHCYLSHQAFRTALLTSWSDKKKGGGEGGIKRFASSTL